MIQLLIILTFIVVPVILSVTAFKGGHSLSYYQMLLKMNDLNEKIIREGDASMLIELDKFLTSISPEKTEPSFLDWVRFGFLGPRDKGKR